MHLIHKQFDFFSEAMEYVNHNALVNIFHSIVPINYSAHNKFQLILRFDSYPAYTHYCEKLKIKPMSTADFFYRVDTSLKYMTEYPPKQTEQQEAPVCRINVKNNRIVPNTVQQYTSADLSDGMHDLFIKNQSANEPETNVIDLDALTWEQIKQAANESNWIPPEYMMNEWVADVCEFLQNRQDDTKTKQTLEEIVKTLSPLTNLYESNYDGEGRGNRVGWAHIKPMQEAYAKLKSLTINFG